MRLHLGKVCVVLIAFALASAPVAHALAMVHMADAKPAMSDVQKSDDCGACSMDAGKALGTCAAICGSIGAAVLAADEIIPADASAGYLPLGDVQGISRAPPPDTRPPKQ